MLLELLSTDFYAESETFNIFLRLYLSLPLFIAVFLISYLSDYTLALALSLMIFKLTIDLSFSITIFFFSYAGYLFSDLSFYDRYLLCIWLMPHKILFMLLFYLLFIYYFNVFIKSRCKIIFLSIDQIKSWKLFQETLKNSNNLLFRRMLLSWRNTVRLNASYFVWYMNQLSFQDSSLIN